VVFEGRRYVPVRNVAYSYPDALDPVVACGWGSGEWRDEAHRVRKESFGLEEFVEPVPEPLAAAMAGDNGAVAALERAFYWTRDKLKYAALPAAMRHIGGNDRGREIVRAGTGDCKDKSYLLALVCRDLGIPCEFVLASSKRGVIQEDLPGPQFDHVFVRAQGPEGWLYMDPASPQTVFGSPHPNQQGMRGMVLNDEARFFTYPADPPERNRLTIREQLTGVRDSWVEGTFEIEATGNVARETDEVFKGASLSFSDPLQAAENALGGLLSQVVIDEFERLSDTGVSDVFRVRGRHRRSPLATLELSGRRTARLTWIIPPVPSWFWRKLTLDTMFEVRYPVHAVIELEVTGDLRRDLEEVSGTPVLRNELGTIEHTRTETEDSMIIRREISFWEKQVEGERLSLVAPMMEALEQALRIVLSFRSESQTDV
jgi:transglutaminase-like putative cysteine protease